MNLTEKFEFFLIAMNDRINDILQRSCVDKLLFETPLGPNGEVVGIRKGDEMEKVPYFLLRDGSVVRYYALNDVLFTSKYSQLGEFFPDLDAKLDLLEKQINEVPQKVQDEEEILSLIMTSRGLNEVCDLVHDANVAKGFYDKEKSFPEIIALCHSELSEALEADRKLRWVIGDAAKTTLQIKNDTLFKDEFKQHVKDTVEDEIADEFIRLMDLCGYYKIDIENHIAAKLRFNKLREYKHGNKAY